MTDKKSYCYHVAYYAIDAEEDVRGHCSAVVTLVTPLTTKETYGRLKDMIAREEEVVAGRPEGSIRVSLLNWILLEDEREQ